MDETLISRCRDRGFTPGVRDVPVLLDGWERACQGGSEAEGLGPREVTKAVVDALSRSDLGVAKRLLRGWSEVGGEQRVLRLRVLARLGQRLPLPAAPLRELVMAALRDPEPRVVREAARAVGKLPDAGGADHAAALLQIAEQAALPERRAAVEALGRVAGPEALERLRALPPEDDELRRRTAEAITLIVRRSEREVAGAVRLDERLPQRVRVRLRCRGGAAATVVEQAQDRLLVSHRDVQRCGPDAVELPWSATLRELYQVRSAIEPALVFALPPAGSLVDRVVEGLLQPALVEALQAWTDGPPRFRLGFGSGGRRRARVWAVARRLAERGSALRNDSREVTWSVEVDEEAGVLRCMPRGADPRFGYRVADLPAASHPTVAATIAWVGRPQPGEVVWDPFCGSGLELVEAAMLAPGLHLWGTDISTEALAAAASNLAAASLEVASTTLRCASALSVVPRPEAREVSLIVTNPPMGRRVEVGGDGLRRLLHDVVTHAAAVLASGGRMVWLSPAPRATAESARAAGLQPHDLDTIDMGSFFATLQVLRKPS